MDNLPDDCMIIIFSHTSNVDFFIFQLVCKRWRRIFKIEMPQKINYLDLSYTRIRSGNFLPLENLQILDLSHTAINNSCFKHLTRIHTLNLSGCRNLTLNENFRHLISLTDLNLSNVKNGIILSPDPNYKCNATKYLAKLHKLNLSNFEYCHFLNFYYLRNIYDLDLSYTFLTNDEIKYFTNVKYLNITKCYYITDNVLRYFTELRGLNISRCKNITGTGMIFLTNLTSLDISYNKIMTATSINKCIKLQYLNVVGCHNVSLERLCLPDIKKIMVSLELPIPLVLLDKILYVDK